MSLPSPKRILYIAVLAALIRIAYVVLNNKLGYGHNLDILGLPALEGLSLLFVFGISATPWKEREGIVSTGINLLAAVTINAFLRILDYARVFRLCETDTFFRQNEAMCEATVIQNFCNVPFVFIALIVLLVWSKRPRTSPAAASPQTHVV